MRIIVYRWLSNKALFKIFYESKDQTEVKNAGKELMKRGCFG